MEATFARNFVNPTDGPDSEDGAAYDPASRTIDFPSYRENAFAYTYDNVAVLVLNSNYWYAPSITSVPQSGGNLHGYVMDNQLAWIAKTLDRFEREAAIDHVFLTLHTPVFPNGGHSGDDMWYSGRNDPRPTIAGKPVARGIIERRDDLLALIEAHPKVLALLTGDEHNYNLLRLGPGVEIYPPGWDKPKVTLGRTFFQVNNGAAGAPYYGQEQLPWSAHVSGFSTQNALCLLHVEGKSVRLEAVNPLTLEVFHTAVLR
jgi:3',5'-cyclic AMP phosphodiesterase CpdA